MNIILETQRLLLRELTPGDYPQFYDLNNDPEVIKYLGDGAFASLNAAKKFLENYTQYDKYGIGRWAVILKSTKEFTGWCGLKYQHEVTESGAVDLGYRYFRKFWNSGIATESAKASIDFGFEKMVLKRIIGRVMKDNKASIRVLEKCGMHFTEKIVFDEHPGLLYEILNPKWIDKKYIPIDCNFYDELEALATLQVPSEIVFKNNCGVTEKVTSSITNLFAKKKEEFMELEDGRCVRLDKLISIDGKQMNQMTSC